MNATVPCNPSTSQFFQSPEIGSLTEALVHFHTKCPKIPKDRRGTYGKYADLSTIIELVQPVLNECGLAVIQMPTGEFGLITLLAHTSGEFIGSKYEMQPEERIVDKATKEKAITPQSIGAVITYQRRYALGAILSLNIDDDTDADSPKDSEPPKKIMSAQERIEEAKKAKAAANSSTTEVKSEATSTAAATPAPTTQPPTTTESTTTKLLTDGDGTTKQSENEPCGEALAKQIKDALSQLEQQAQGSTEAFVKKLWQSRGKGAKFATHLSVAEAKSAIKHIEEKNIAAFFEKSLQAKSA